MEELSDGEIDRLLESANEDVDYIEERKTEMAYHFWQQHSHYVSNGKASRQLLPSAKQVGKAVLFK